jgi:hypothetical protein
MSTAGERGRMQQSIKTLIDTNRAREGAAWPERPAVVSGLLGQYLRVWSAATSSDERLDTALRIFAADGVYKDPMTAPLDPPGLVRHIEDVVLPNLQGFDLKPVGAPQVHGRCVLFSWEYAVADGRRGSFPGSSGTDFAQISEAGLFERVIGFFDITLTNDAAPA